MPWNTTNTQKPPEAEYRLERPSLKQYIPMAVEAKESHQYHVRKTNTIAYKSNFYSLPYGTYKEIGVQVSVKENEDTLEIYTTEGQLICTHELCLQKGQTIINNNHKRDTSKSLDLMTAGVITYFTDKPSATDYINLIRARLPRYIRDHLQVIEKALCKEVSPQEADETLTFCLKNQLFSGYEFSQALQLFMSEQTKTEHKDIALLNKDNLSKASEEPEVSNIEDYENIVNL